MVSQRLGTTGSTHTTVTTSKNYKWTSRHMTHAYYTQTTMALESWDYKWMIHYSSLMRPSQNPKKQSYKRQTFWQRKEKSSHKPPQSNSMEATSSKKRTL